MEIFKGIILGFVQGLTEFLPVSSSGHILLFEKFLGCSGGLLFSLMLHLGTLFSIVVFMWKKIISALKNKKTILKLLIATVPAGVIGVLFSDLLDRVFFGGNFIWLGFMATAIYLRFAEIAASKRKKPLKPLRTLDSLYLGLSQGVAVIPAVSRSGTVFATGLILGYEKEELSDFTFLMSLPVIGGGCVYELIKCIIGKNLGSINLPSMLLGMAAAFMSGLVALEIAGGLFKKGNLKYFSLYLAVLSLILVITGV